MTKRWKAYEDMAVKRFTEDALGALEPSRNTDPGIANVKDGTSYKIYNESLEGTYEVFDTIPTPVNHNWGGADALRYTDIVGATVTAYLTTDYSANRLGSKYIRGKTTTDVNGRWNEPMFLDAGAYTIVFYKAGGYGPDTATATVTATSEVAITSGGTNVNENTGGTDALRVVDSEGEGMDNCDIYVYLTSDYSSGNITQSYIKGHTRTKNTGRWESSINLPAGSYTIVFHKEGQVALTSTTTVS